MFTRKSTTLQETRKKLLSGTPASGPSSNNLQAQMDNLTVADDQMATNARYQPTLQIESVPAYHSSQMSPLQSPFSPAQNQRSYLLEDLRRQQKKAKLLFENLSSAEKKIALPHSKAGQARKLRKGAGLLKCKIAETAKQEQLIALRLHELDIEDYNREMQFQPRMLRQAMAWNQYPDRPWTQSLIAPTASPLSPISPMTPLPPGYYQAFPTAPSPLESHYKYYAPEWQAESVVVFDKSVRRQSLDEQKTEAISSLETLEQQVSDQTQGVDIDDNEVAVYSGRRWSVGDVYNPATPSPEDRRMSVPDLRTIWRSA